VAAGAGELFDRGTEALQFNRPREAVTLLEQAITAEPVNGPAYIYLAIGYEQLTMHERAIATLRRAETIPGIDLGAVRFNLGNNYLHLGERAEAIAAYTSAIEANPMMTEPYLNRANLEVEEGSYDEAVADYNSVLGLEPNHPQREEIERMIALLLGAIEQERIQAEEEARRLAEQERLQQEEEARRLAEEERQRQEAEDRRRALLSNVLDSIRTSAEETENMSAGSEDVDTYEEEFDIAD
jgi:tetratricopeptide (TPR) repeat protein